jgi:hypothetical protein
VVEVAIALLEKEETGPVCIVGHSFGTFMASRILQVGKALPGSKKAIYVIN